MLGLNEIPKNCSRPELDVPTASKKLGTVEQAMVTIGFTELL
jgi:hypothetical protein